MNAYELANKLENKDRLWSIDEKLMLNTCKMLRQQADRIAHLEMLLANRNEIIDKLDLTTPQIKELSDEEIVDLWMELFDESMKDIKVFARAMLKKASEK